VPDPEDLATRPWLRGLVACALHHEAMAVRGALHARGLRWSSVPAGEAVEAWTCVTDAGTLAVVVSGPGAERARAAASFWMPRSRELVVVGAGRGTGLVRPPAVVLDGDARLRRRAESGASPAVEVIGGRVGHVEAPVRSAQAWESLAAAGYAAVTSQLQPWREAAAAVGAPMLVCQGVPAGAEASEAPGAGDQEAGHGGRAGLARLLPGRRGAHRLPGAATAAVLEAAAACATAALLGRPGPPAT
jgi:hypothetical protein